MLSFPLGLYLCINREVYAVVVRFVLLLQRLRACRELTRQDALGLGFHV